MSGEVTQFQKAPQEVSVMYTLPQVSYVFSLNAVEKGQYQIKAKKLQYMFKLRWYKLMVGALTID